VEDDWITRLTSTCYIEDGVGQGCGGRVEPGPELVRGEGKTREGVQLHRGTGSNACNQHRQLERSEENTKCSYVTLSTNTWYLINYYENMLGFKFI